LQRKVKCNAAWVHFPGKRSLILNVGVGDCENEAKRSPPAAGSVGVGFASFVCRVGREDVRRLAPASRPCGAGAGTGADGGGARSEESA